MKLHCLGTGGYHPSERRHTACYLLPEVGVAFDAGTAFFRVPQRLENGRLDVFLSHAHLDHVVGLTFPLVAMQQKIIERMRIHAEPKHLDTVRTHITSSPLFPVDPDFEYVPLADRVPVAGGGTLTHCPLVHPGGATGFRIDWPDRSLAYITDTNAPGEYGEFIRGVDLLIHECYFPDGQAEWAATTGHSHATPVGELARDAGVGRMYLVHTDPQSIADDPIGLETVRAIFPNTEIPEDLDVIEF
jgi:ribonuclease Z